METQQLVKKVHLRYVTDKKPGFTRKKENDEFSYFNTEGRKITDEDVIERIDHLAIPPAWKQVWICPSENGHLQATGYDDKGRKQYRYHPEWNKLSQEQKFDRMLVFAQKLPDIRKRIRRDMALPRLTREKVLSTIVWLLEKTYIRIGNEEYKKENHSYGLTTIKNNQAMVKGNTVKFSFKGKSGVYHDVRITSKRVARVVRRCQELPGQELFCYRDENGEYRDVTSDEVNAYLKEITGEEITAKDFRTWGGTNLAAKLFDEVGCVETQTELKKNTVEVVKRVAAELRNRPATCRKYYIHPCIVEAYTEGKILSTITRRSKLVEELDEYENCVLQLLQATT